MGLEILAVLAIVAMTSPLSRETDYRVDEDNYNPSEASDSLQKGFREVIVGGYEPEQEDRDGFLGWLRSAVENW